MNLANILTVSRLVLLPVPVFCFRNGLPGVAAATFLVLMATDCLDGPIARKTGRRTRIGLYLDPVVDKIVVIVLLYELARSGLLPFAVPHLTLARELLQNAVRSVASTRGEVVGANWMGKTKALLQTGVIAGGLFLPAFVDASSRGGAVFLLNIAAWSVVGLSWIFFLIFAYWNRRLLREKPDTRDGGA